MGSQAALLLLLVVIVIGLLLEQAPLASAFLMLRPASPPAPTLRVRKGAGAAAAPRRADGLRMMAAAVDPQRLPDLSQVMFTNY